MFVSSSCLEEGAELQSHMSGFRGVVGGASLCGHRLHRRPQFEAAVNQSQRFHPPPRLYHYSSKTIDLIGRELRDDDVTRRHHIHRIRDVRSDTKLTNAELIDGLRFSLLIGAAVF